MTSGYDYVIVGAGSAGCVLAARLSQDPDVRVAVIEAGGPDDAPEISVPLAFPSLLKTRFDWDFASEPEPALGRRRLALPRGKTLGGSSSINAMIYIRGNHVDFDDWARQGATGWSAKGLAPYFIKAEANGRGDDRFHGRHGPLSVSDSRSMQPLVERFVQAGVAAGYAYNADFNGASQLGVGRYQLTQRDGARCSSARAYLHPAADRPNLFVFTDALALRVLFTGPRATGVSIVHNGAERDLYADREVILSAGAYGSPQILMLSGIGPADHLKSLGIQPRAHLPVGENLQDHVWVPLSYLTDEPTLFRAGSEEDLKAYQKHRRGPLSSNAGEGGGFMMTRPDLKAPDLQLFMGPVMSDDEAFSPPYDDGFSILPCLLKPTSRGKVTLRSAAPDAKPRIFGNHLTTAEDRNTLLAGVKIGLEIGRQATLAAVTRSIHRAPETDSDADIWSYLQQYAGTVFHPTSTCSIGPVLDPSLRVHGVDGLRVVDASVMPSIVRGNTNAAVIAIAEKAADIIAGRETAEALDRR
jgi:choline dehydrogenase